MVFGSVWIQGNCRRSRCSLGAHSEPGPRRLRYLWTRLWTGRRGRFLWTRARFAARAQRRSNLLALGTAGLFRQLHGRARRSPGTSGAVVRSGRVCRPIAIESLCARGAGGCVYLPPGEVRLAGTALAAVEAVAVTWLLLQPLIWNWK